MEVSNTARAGARTQIINTPAGTRGFQLLQWKYALKLEILGLRHSQGSVYAHVKRQLGFKGNKRSVLAQLENHIAQFNAANGFTTPEVQS